MIFHEHDLKLHADRATQSERCERRAHLKNAPDANVRDSVLARSWAEMRQKLNGRGRATANPHVQLAISFSQALEHTRQKVQAQIEIVVVDAVMKLIEVESPAVHRRCSAIRTINTRTQPLEVRGHAAIDYRTDPRMRYGVKDTLDLPRERR